MPQLCPQQKNLLLLEARLGTRTTYSTLWPTFQDHHGISWGGTLGRPSGSPHTHLKAGIKSALRFRPVMRSPGLRFYFRKMGYIEPCFSLL